MYDGGKIIIGLVVFLVLVTFPIWYNVAKGDAVPAPELEKATGATECVEDAEYMTGFHMDVLNQWRDDVVRRGDRFYVNAHGEQVEKSLSNTCLSCHQNKDKFCDRCHTYMGVDPYCWDCHVIPKEVAGGN